MRVGVAQSNRLYKVCASEPNDINSREKVNLYYVIDQYRTCPPIRRPRSVVRQYMAVLLDHLGFRHEMHSILLFFCVPTLSGITILLEVFCARHSSLSGSGKLSGEAHSHSPLLVYLSCTQPPIHVRSPRYLAMAIQLHEVSR